MKKNCILFCLLLLQIGFNSSAQELEQKTDLKKMTYAYSPDGKVYFEMSTKKILVKFNPSIGFAEQARLLKNFPEIASLKKDQLLPSPKVSLLELKENLNETAIKSLLKRIQALNEVVYANPFLIYFDGTQQGITDRFMVKLKSASGIQLLREASTQYKFNIIENHKYDKLVYFIETNKNSVGNALEIANALVESKNFVTAEPDYLLLLKKFSTNDTFLPYQWSLNNTGTAIQYSGTVGCDMKIFNAWTLSTGVATIKVAVIDEGVDLVHPDLQANIVAGYDGTLQGSGGAPQGDDAHGTACAGIIAASGNNNLGIAGIAYNAKIVPVRIAYSSGSSWVTSNAWIGASIDWAWDTGDADVLSNSWGGGSSSSLINDAITRSVTLGRGGLGAPVLFAAGNSNGAVSYPATLANVISVTAMSMCNQRKSTTSCDGETFWGSNYGVNGDISAPGVKIYTTDISGASGYGTGDYTATFNGTSSACPNAAGVMALILSINPSLTNTSARQIIESTCDKVGGYTYNSGVSGQPNGTWSNDLGYGRVNAFSALQAANPQPCVNPPPVATTNASPSSICVPTSVNFTLTGILYGTGQTYQWQSSPNNTTYTNISGATSSAYNATVSASTWFRCIVTCGTATNSTPVQVTYINPTVSTFPHTENFNASTALPCGWSVNDVNSDGKTWSILTLNSQSAPNNLTYSYSATNAANDWTFSMPLSLVAGTSYQVRFSYRVRSATYPENLEVKWGNAASVAGMTSAAIFTGTNLTNTTYLQTTTSAIAPSTTGIYYVGFRAFSVANMYDINIDDVTFEIIPSCTTPPLAGTISGPLSVAGGSSNTYNLIGNTGTIQWQQSSDNINWTSVAGGTSNTLSIVLLPGTQYLRSRSSLPGCVDAFSNVLTITVSSTVGDVQSNPIMATLPFTQTISNGATSGFLNNYTGTNNQSSADFFIQFTTDPCADSIKISTCSSGFDTYVHLLSSTGAHLASNDDDGPYCTGTAASMKFDISPSTTYYAVFEGYNTSTGNIIANIENVGNSILALTATASGATTFCQGGNVVLTVSPATGIVWSTGETTASITVSASGNYYAYIPGAPGCTPTSNVITVVSNPLPIVAASNVSGCASTPINLIGTPVGGTFSIANPYTGPSTTYTYTYTDANGCTATSAPATVTTTAGLCYCIPTLASGALGCTDGDVIVQLKLNTLDNNSGTGCPGGLGAYSDYSSTVGLTTSVQAGVSYNLEITVGQYGQNAAVWMDLNDDGIFDISERLNYTTSEISGGNTAGSVGSTGLLPIVIPCNTPIGNHRMRVRCNYSVSTAGIDIVPCVSTAFYGETEDYTIDVQPCSSQLNLKFFIEGFYISAQTMEPVLLNSGVVHVPPYTNLDADLVEVSLHNPTSPYALVETTNGVLKTDGTLQCSFANNYSTSYFIVITHRNAVETWSASPVLLSSSTSYDFTTSANKAYGANQKEVEPGVFALFTGDINQDGFIDGFDYPDFDSDSQNNLSGVYVATDLNGDGYVDGFDYPVFDENSQSNVSVITP